MDSRVSHLFLIGRRDLILVQQHETLTTCKSRDGAVHQITGMHFNCVPVGDRDLASGRERERKKKKERLNSQLSRSYPAPAFCPILSGR